MDLSEPPQSPEPGGIDWDLLAKDGRFTESRQDLVKLYDLARLGQFNDDEMRSLTKDQLVFLAAHDPAVSSFDVELRLAEGARDAIPNPTPEYRKAAKKVHDLAKMKNVLEQNARRARLELDRRRDVARTRWQIIAVIIAAIIGVAGAVIGALIASP